MISLPEKSNPKDSRVIIFSHYRESVKEILGALGGSSTQIFRPAQFIGQSSAGDRLKGQTQKMQQAILQKFRSGEYNILVATSIGEEGLDIVEVDLVICDYYPSGQVSWSKSVCVPSSPVKKYPVHSFFCGDYVAVDVRGYVSITFVPALPRTSEFHKDTRNVNWQYKVQNKTTPYKLTTDVSGPRTDGTYSSKLIFADNASNLDPHSPDYSEQYDPGRHPLPATPSSPTEKWDIPCNTELSTPALSLQEDTELSPRLTHYIEEGIVPESPVLEVTHQKLEIDRAADLCFVHKVGSSKAHTQGNGRGCHDESSFGEKGQFPAQVTEVLGLPRDNVLDHTQAEAEEPSNVKICSPAARTPTENLLCDSLSDDCQVKSVAGDTSGSVLQAPKYRRLCKYGEKIKKVPSISLNDGYGGGQCDVANKSMPNQMGHARGNKGKAKRRLDIYIDEQAEVSEDADISADEDDDQSEDKYEDSFIDDQTTPSGQFTQTQSEQGGEHTGDIMAFYRRSLLTQSTVVLPSRYQDLSDNSVSRVGSASCSSGSLHNPIDTPQGILQKHGTTGPSPLCPQQSSLERATSIKDHGQASVVNCESTTKPDSIKRKLSFQQAASIPIINLEPEPAAPSSHVATEVSDDIYWDDAFFENLDLDAIEAQATEQLRLQRAQSQKPAETKRASDVSFTPPSFDLGI
uniref:Uncharacterized protein n=1 Tax=Avena sativa TaxID=4498 RepID=A0ACD5X537_AVESA